jgi:hypothetical protein
MSLIKLAWAIVNNGLGTAGDIFVFKQEDGSDYLLNCIHNRIILMDVTVVYSLNIYSCFCVENMNKLYLCIFKQSIHKFNSK